MGESHSAKCTASAISARHGSNRELHSEAGSRVSQKGAVITSWVAGPLSHHIDPPVQAPSQIKPFCWFERD